MSRTISAIYDSGVFRLLEPVDLAEGTPVTVQFQISVLPDSDEVDQETRLAWQAYLERMESLSDPLPPDGLSNRDHDQILYGG